MKLIEAMKRVKGNKEKINDLQERVSKVSANLNYETPLYGDETPAKIKEWLQSCTDLTQENVRLLVSIARTNLATPVTITLGEKNVTKSIAEWVWRRREYANVDLTSWSKLTDRGLKEASGPSSTGVLLEIKLVRHYDPAQRDAMLAMYKSEPHEIDSALEVVNAVTDLIEA
jgi:hypothetical protein